MGNCAMTPSYSQRTTWPNHTAWQIGGPADRRSRRRWNGLSSRASIVAIAFPAWFQFSTTEGQSPRQCVPGARRPSKSGVPGLPGSKCGPRVTRSGTTALEGCTEAAKWRSLKGYRASRQQKQVRPSGLRTPPNKPDRCGKAAANFASGAINDPVQTG